MRRWAGCFVAPVGRGSTKRWEHLLSSTHVASMLPKRRCWLNHSGPIATGDRESSICRVVRPRGGEFINHIGDGFRGPHQSTACIPPSMERTMIVAPLCLPPVSMGRPSTTHHHTFARKGRMCFSMGVPGDLRADWLPLAAALVFNRTSPSQQPSTAPTSLSSRITPREPIRPTCSQTTT